jgi:hypothetical protein
MEIKNPRRILALGSTDSDVLKLLAGKHTYYAALKSAYPTRTHRVRPRTRLRLRRRPHARMAPRDKVLHHNASHLGRRDHRRSRMADRIHRTRSS